jgi:hypothetical protein
MMAMAAPGVLVSLRIDSIAFWSSGMECGPLLVSTPTARDTLKPISKQADSKRFFIFGLGL